MNRVLLASIAGLAIGGSAVGMIAAPMVVATFIRPGEASDINQEFHRALLAHSDAVSLHARRFDGRSAFHPAFNPNPEPVQPLVDEESTIIVEHETDDSVAPVVEESEPAYTGPAVIGCDGFAVYFENDIRIRIGDEDSTHRITVVSANMPWSVHLIQGDWEGDQPLFERAWESTLHRGTAAFDPQPGNMR